MNPYDIHTQFDQYLGIRLRAFRTMKKWTQEDLGTHVGVTRSTISKFEAGVQPCPVEVLFKMSAALGYSMDLIVYAPWDTAEQLADLTARIEQAKVHLERGLTTLSTPTDTY